MSQYHNLLILNTKIDWFSIPEKSTLVSRYRFRLPNTPKTIKILELDKEFQVFRLNSNIFKQYFSWDFVKSMAILSFIIN